MKDHLQRIKFILNWLKRPFCSHDWLRSCGSWLSHDSEWTCADCGATVTRPSMQFPASSLFSTEYLNPFDSKECIKECIRINDRIERDRENHLQRIKSSCSHRWVKMPEDYFQPYSCWVCERCLDTWLTAPPDQFGATIPGTIIVEDILAQWKEWETKQFPQATTQSRLAHLKKEVSVELLAEPDDIMEYVDAFSSLMMAAKGEGIEFQDIVDAMPAKLEINKNREWGKPNADGFVEHVPATNKRE